MSEETDQQTEQNADQQPMEENHKAVMNLYIGVGVSLLLSLLPTMSSALFSLLFLISVFIGAYYVRGTVERGSLTENHSTYIIRTLWIASFFSLVTTGAASAYMLNQLDYSMFHPCMDELGRQGTAFIESAGMMDIFHFIKPCVDGFLEENREFFMKSVLIAGGPVFAYAAFRLIKGLGKFNKDEMIENHLGWF